MQTSLMNPSERSFNLKVIFIFTVMVLDALSTEWLMLRHGFGELNPFMAMVADVLGVPGMTIFKITTNFIIMLWLVDKKPFRKLIDWLIIGYLGIYMVGLFSQLV